MRIALVSECPTLAAGLKVLRPQDEVVRVRLKDLNTTKAEVAIVDVESELSTGSIQDLKQIRGHNIMLYGGCLTQPMCRIAVNNGVKAAVLKSAPEEELSSAIDTVGDGQMTWDNKTLMALMSTRVIQLTGRESDLCSLLGMGLANKEIGARLHISEGTVKVYFSRLFQKLGVSNRWELSVWVRSNFLASNASPTAEVPRIRAIAPIK